MDKCKRVKQTLYHPACSYRHNYYTQMDDAKESYFIKRDELPYIREYGFETLPELEEELNQMWNEDPVMLECMKVVLVSALKLKSQDAGEDYVQHSKEHGEEKLPAYIYNF